MNDLELPRVTGVMVQYYFACLRELWFFTHHLHQEESVDLELGKLIHEVTYSHEKKGILIDETIAPDFLKKRGDIIILEIKKSERLKEPAKYQLLYYLWYLEQKGINAKGMIVYPKEKKKEEIVLSEELKKKFPKILEEIEKIIKLPQPPKIEKKKYCRRCSYFEFCWTER